MHLRICDDPAPSASFFGIGGKRLVGAEMLVTLYKGATRATKELKLRRAASAPARLPDLAAGRIAA